MFSDYIIMIILGCLCILVPSRIITILSKIEWHLWKIFLRDNTKEFKSYFENRNPALIRVLGIVLLVGPAVGIVLNLI